MKTGESTIAILLLLAWTVSAGTMEKAVNEHVSKLSETNIKLSISLYKQLVADKNIDNVIFSPISISVAMAMAHMGAKGVTADQIYEAFMFSDIEDGKFHSAFGELHGLMFGKQYENVTMKSSNRVFIDDKINTLEDYKNALTVYGAQVDQIDFSNRGAAVNRINGWMKEVTNGKISSLVFEDFMKAETALLIANAVYFKGDWHSKFVESQTEKRAFYVSHYKVVDTLFMFQRGKFRFGYIDALTLQVLEMQYTGKDFSMVILLPDNFDLNAVEKSLNYENLTSWLDTLEYRNVDLTLPKFKIEETLPLQEILPNIGVVNMFSKEKSDLSGISSQAEGLFVDQVVHKSVLEIDENGGMVEAERADANRAKDRVVVYADHPFILLIRSRASNAFHLMGAYKRPVGKVRSHDEL